MEDFDGTVVTSTILSHNSSVWAQYTIRVLDRAAMQAAQKEKGIPIAVYYPIPLHSQDAFAEFSQQAVTVPNTDKANYEVMSLPMHPFLTKEDTTIVANAIWAAIDG